MSTCSLIEKCIFFNNQMANMPSTAEAYKKIYCQQDFEKCARYRIVQTLGREFVPPDLYPNQDERACQLIEGKLPQVKYS